MPYGCLCHLSVNPALQLLRTVLERPSLAKLVKCLTVSVVRRDIGELCHIKDSRFTLDIDDLRQRCTGQLRKLGYGIPEVWETALENNIESAYAGVLLCVLPRLMAVDYSVKELRRGHYYNVKDSIEACFAKPSPPAALEVAFRCNLQTLDLRSDLSFLHAFAFDNLKCLRIGNVNFGTLLQLNGPNTFRVTPHLNELDLGLSPQLLEETCINDMHVNLRSLIDALGCHSLAKLRICIDLSDRCRCPAYSYDAQVLLDQLSGLKDTLEVLAIDMDPLDGPSEWGYFLNHTKHITSSLKGFTNLKELTMPQMFLFGTEFEVAGGVMPQDLPPMLRCLELLAPDSDVFEWAKHISAAATELTNLREIYLDCQSGVNLKASDITENVEVIWSSLFRDFHIRTYVYDVAEHKTSFLPKLYDEENGLDVELESNNE